VAVVAEESCAQAAENYVGADTWRSLVFLQVCSVCYLWDGWMDMFLPTGIKNTAA
jgi:hypothetical protein